MNCIEFHRRLYTDPARRVADFRRHRYACPSCAALAERMEILESGLESALDIDVPASLGSDIREQIRMAEEERSSGRHSMILAAAVSIVLMAGLLSYLIRTPSVLPLNEAVVAHIENELDHLYQLDDVPGDTVGDVISRSGGMLRADIGTVNYAGLCRIRKYNGGHLVLPGSKGPVTVLLMPGEHVATRMDILSGLYHGVVIPVAKGSIAIVGVHGEPLEVLEQHLSRSIDWI